MTAATERDTIDRLNAALDVAAQVTHRLALIAAAVDERIEARAQELARQHIVAADEVARVRVARAEHDRDRQHDLVAEMRRILAAVDRARDLAVRERDQARARVEELLGTIGVGRGLVPSYVTDVVKALRTEVPDCDTDLLRLYALLALTSGVNTTLEQVHDAWALWRAGTPQGHPSLVPFGELSPEVQELDRPYAVAIRRVARALHQARQEPEGVSRG